MTSADIPHRRRYLKSSSSLTQAANAGVLGRFPRGKRIYLEERLSLQDGTFASSILAQEMVHYLQPESGKFSGSYSCKSAIPTEREPYSVQHERACQFVNR